jgi:hypothetical protein
MEQKKSVDRLTTQLGHVGVDCAFDQPPATWQPDFFGHTEEFNTSPQRGYSKPRIYHVPVSIFAAVRPAGDNRTPLKPNPTSSRKSNISRGAVCEPFSARCAQTQSPPVTHRLLATPIGKNYNVLTSWNKTASRLGIQNTMSPS